MLEVNVMEPETEAIVVLFAVSAAKQSPAGWQDGVSMGFFLKKQKKEKHKLEKKKVDN